MQHPPCKTTHIRNACRIDLSRDFVIALNPALRTLLQAILQAILQVIFQIILRIFCSINFFNSTGLRFKFCL